ncbi:MAG TPA: acyltransferase, partial [Kiritimatiellia bacterium]|nr:acyltransferase [Kiritimatiellia bacterium]
TGTFEGKTSNHWKKRYDARNEKQQEYFVSLSGFIACRLAGLARRLHRAEEQARVAEVRRAAGIGKDVFIPGDLIVKKPSKLSIGDRTYVSRGCFFDCKGGLEIGHDCHISAGCVIYTHDHDINERLPFGKEILKPVKIGDYVWIGAAARIVPGVTIGSGAVIGFGCLVTSDVGEGEIVGSPSVRVLKTRDPEVWRRLQAEVES